MHLADFIDRVCDDGIAAAKRDYADKPAFLEGAVEGFEACRGKTTHEILETFTGAALQTDLARRDENLEPDECWRLRCKAAEIEWVLNCVSAVLSKPLLHWLPTYRGALKAFEVVRDLLASSTAPAHERLNPPLEGNYIDDSH